MKKRSALMFISLISMLACGCEFRVYPPSLDTSSEEASSVETTPLSGTNSIASTHTGPIATVDTRSDSSEPSLEPSSESSPEEVHAESLRVGLFEKMPKNGDICVLYPNSEFDLDYAVYPDNALEKDVVFRVNEDALDIIDVAKGKIITKNKYSTTPFTITVTVENTDIRIVQKVAVVPGEKFISLRLKEHFDATNYGERYQARNSYFKMFDTFNANEDASATNEMDVTYFENELTSIQRYKGEFNGKYTKRLDDNYFCDVRYKQDGTIDYDSSYKYEFGEKASQNQITRKSAEEQVNYPLFTNDIYGTGNYFAFLTSTYESMGVDNWYFDETLRFDVKEDSDSRFYADVAGKKSDPNSTDIVYVNAIFDVRFDSVTKITSFKYSAIYTTNEDPTKTTTFGKEALGMTFVANIDYDDGTKIANPTPADFSDVALKLTPSKEIANRITTIANKFNGIETKKVQRIRMVTNYPDALNDTYLVEYYKNETIEEATTVYYNGGGIETESTYTKKAKTIRDGKLYELTLDSEANKYIVDNSTVIGAAEGQISQEDANYEANHSSYMGEVFDSVLQLGLEFETIAYPDFEITFDNIKAGIRADNETSFSYYCNYSRTVTIEGRESIDWAISDVELSFVKDVTSGDILLSGFRINDRYYTENPFDGNGDLKEDAFPYDSSTRECTIEYYSTDTKDENPNPIEFSIDETSAN